MGLLDEITKLTTPATELPDLEDELDASSLLKPSGNRSKKVQNFNFEEGKYAGAAVSRKDIFGDVSEISGLKGKEDSEESEVDDEDESSDEINWERDPEDKKVATMQKSNILGMESEDELFGDSEEEVEDEDDNVPESDWEREPEEETVVHKQKSKILETMNSDDDDDDDEDMEDGEDEGDSDEAGDDEEEEEENESNLGMTTLSLKDDSDKADKATSVLHQRQVWDDLSYSNIRMHALLNAMNQMPRGETRKNLLKTCDSTTQKSLESAMENMAKLRDLMKTAAVFFGEEKKEDSDDEEIPSDEEILSNSEGEDEGEDMEDSEDEEDIQKASKNQEGTSLKTLKKNLDSIDSSMDKFRSTTITKWYNRTKVLNSKCMNNTDFSVFEKGSILGQINKVLADEDKLLKKVHTNRSGKPRIGAPTTPDTTTDPEIFDDSDFYQLLLKQMLEARNQMSQSTQDGADMTRSYMELQSMIGNKKKRDVSQLSSKDRKLKYEPIAKLINFYPSKPSVATWTHESRNELFKSLFS